MPFGWTGPSHSKVSSATSSSARGFSNPSLRLLQQTPYQPGEELLHVKVTGRRFTRCIYRWRGEGETGPADGRPASTLMRNCLQYFAWFTGSLDAAAESAVRGLTVSPWVTYVYRPGVISSEWQKCGDGCLCAIGAAWPLPTTSLPRPRRCHAVEATVSATTVKVSFSQLICPTEWPDLSPSFCLSARCRPVYRDTNELLQ